MKKFDENEEEPVKPLEDIDKIAEEGIAKTEGKDLSDGIDTMEIQIANEPRGITVRIQCDDPTDAVFLAGFIITGFRKLGIEGTSKVMP